MLTKLMKNYFLNHQKRKLLLMVILMTSLFGLVGMKPITPATPANTADDPLAAFDTTKTIDEAVPEYVILRPSEEVTFASEIVASVASINVKEGSSFLKGEELIKFDCRVQEAELAKAKAQKKASDIALNSATKLKKYGSISELEYIQASTQQQINTAEVNKLTAIVDKCSIEAPFNGSVADLFVHPLETVKPGDPLLKIVNTENLSFELQVPSVWLRWMHVGTHFQVTINETSEVFTATITKINPEIDSVSQTLKVVGEINKPNANLRPGMSGQAFFPDNPNNKRKN